MRPPEFALGTIEARNADEMGEMITKIRGILTEYLGSEGEEAFNRKMGDLAGRGTHSLDMSKFYDFLVDHMGGIKPLTNKIVQRVREELTQISGVAPISPSTEMAAVVPKIAPLRPFGGKRNE